MRASIIIAALVLAAGVSMSHVPSASATAPAAHAGAPWHDGSVDEGLKLAKTRNVPVLLYWGAVWCPPCNELKSQVFSQPRFATLVADMVAIYLDGDSEAAQAYGERFNVSGYPTVLVLDASGKETMRLTTSLDLGEFETALEAATRAPRPLAEVVADARRGKATDADWRLLAAFTWIDGEGLALTGKDLLATRAELAEKAPAHLPRVRAQLAIGLAEAAAAAAGDETIKDYVETLRPRARALLPRVFVDAETVHAARAPLVYLSGEIIGWLYPTAGAERRAAEAQWLEATRTLGQNATISKDIRLWAAFPPVAFHQLESKDKPLPAAVRQSVQAAVARADAEATSPFDRKSVISGAAQMLREVDDFDGARRLLEKELKTSDTPWYYESSLASVERAAGRPEEALKWAARARTSAKGRATRLQWIVEDLVLTAKTKTADQEDRLVELVRTYYDTAFSLADGFQGRNATRARKVATSLKPWLTHPSVATVIRTYANKCKTTSPCHPHFTEMGSAPPLN